MCSINNSRQIRCFIFDLDGTLIFNEEANSQAYQATFKRLGLGISSEEYAEYFGLGVEDLLRQYCQRHKITYSNDLLQKIKLIKVDEYASRFHMIQPNHTIVELLKALAPHYHTALATTACKHNASAVLNYVGIINLFDFMIFGEDVKNKKPNPECHYKIAEHFNIKPNECIIFEDSTVGIKAAIAFGAHACKVVK